jgi:hypothetical protein
MRGLRRLGDLFDALNDVVDRRRLLATCLRRVVVRQGAIELHVPALPLLVGPAEGADGAAKVSSFVHPAPAGNPKNGAIFRRTRAEFPRAFSGAISENYGIGERMGVRAGITVAAAHIK